MPAKNVLRSMRGNVIIRGGYGTAYAGAFGWKVRHTLSIVSTTKGDIHSSGDADADMMRHQREPAVLR